MEKAAEWGNIRMTEMHGVLKGSSRINRLLQAAISAPSGHNTQEIERRQDGLTHAAMGLPSIPRWFGRLVMRGFATPRSQARSAAQAIRSSPAMMLFTVDRHDPRGWVDLGRSFQRVALTATTLDIKQAHMNMPCELPALREELRRHLDLGDAQPLLLLRIGYAKPRPRSPRRPVEHVLLRGHCS